MTFDIGEFFRAVAVKANLQVSMVIALTCIVFLTGWQNKNKRSTSRFDWWILQPLKGCIFPYQQLFYRLTPFSFFLGLQRDVIQALMFFGVG